VGRRGNPYDNAKAESFMKTLKTEDVYLGGYETFTDVVHALPRFIDDAGSTQRLGIGARSSSRMNTPTRLANLHP
jgi:putative transposase